MARNIEHLCYGSVELAKVGGSYRLYFYNMKLDAPIIVLDKTFKTLLQAFEDVSPLAIEKSSSDNIDDQVFFEKILDNYNHAHQLSLDGSIYKGKPYIFLKKQYYDAKDQKWKPAKGCISFNWAEDFFKVASLLESIGIKN